MTKNRQWLRGGLRSLIALLLLCTLLLAACGGTTEDATGENAEAAAGSKGSTAAEGAAELAITPNRDLDPAAVRVGMLMGREDGVLSYAAQHGFLRTAENYGYPAKLYTADTSQEAAERIDEAIEEGCKGLLIWADSPEMTAAIEKARARGVKVVVPYEKVSPGVADANLAPDVADYCTEAARILCERIKSRSKSAGTIFVTGADLHPDIAEAFSAAVAEQYPQFKVENYSGANTQEAVNAFVEQHPEMVGVLAMVEGSGKIWNDACNQVQSKLQAEMEALLATPTPDPDASPTPTPKATPTPSPTPTPTGPSPTPDESYRRYANILVLDYTPANVELVRRGVVTGMIARPFYDSAAQSMAVMDNLLRGLPTQTEVRLNTPIIRKDTVAKYDGIIGEVVDWFDVQESPSPSPAPAVTASASSTPAASSATPTATPAEGEAAQPSATSDPLPSALATEEAEEGNGE